MTTEPQGAALSVSPETIVQLAMGFMASKHLFVANEIDLFEHLAASPATLDELAARTGLPRRTVRISADAMVALGLLEREEDRYRNGTVASAYLSGDNSAGMRPALRFLNRISYPTWVGLEQAVRSGESANRQGGGFTEEDQRVFSEGVEAIGAPWADALASVYDFDQHRRVLDLGGGTGSFLLPVLRRYANVEATVFELPGAAAVARQRLSQEPEGTRISVVEGNFFQDPLPSGHDVAIVASILHLFFPEQNRELLRQIRGAMSAGARLLLVDLFTDPTHTDPRAAAMMAGEFLVIAGHGDVYSEDEVRSWLDATGWAALRRLPLAGPASVLIAEAV
jgi:SAM-dependent methyltransferase